MAQNPAELGGEHPGALISDEDLMQADQEAHAATEQAGQQRQAVESTAGAALLRFTHNGIPGPKGLMFVPKPDLSKAMEQMKDKDGNELLLTIAKQVIQGYEFDKRSRGEWETRSQAAMDLALQVTENKSWPWQNAANVKLPLITTAAIQFHARAYPAIVPGQQIVKGVPVGEDKDGSKLERADRVGKHLSYQALEQMPDWEEQTDKLLLNLSIVGCTFRKTYFDRVVAENRSEMVTAKRLVVNHKTKNLIDARRITEEVPLYENDIEERMRSGQFRKVDLTLKAFGEDDDPVHEFLEAHTWYDLDGDGYREPYICTVHVESQQVVRVTARFEADGVTLDGNGGIVKITPEHYYTKFSLIPNPDGGFYDIGLGYLLNPLNESANTVLNQILDAGTLANLGGGFIGKGLRLRGGPVRIAPGEYIQVDAKGGSIKENLVPLDFPGPSAVLFQVLGLLIEQIRDVASVKDILSGESVPANQPATTTLALIDQGLKVFTAIYKRLHRSLKAEFKKLYRLNALFMEPQDYFRFQDMPVEILQQDYSMGDLDILPITDPSVVAGPVKLIKAQALLGLKDDPRVDGREIIRRYLEALEEPNIDKLIPEEGPAQQMQMMNQLKMQMLALEKLSAEVQKLYSETDKNIADGIEKLFKAMATGNAAAAAAEVGALSENAERGQDGTETRGAGGPAVGAGVGDGTQELEAPPDDSQGAGVPERVPAGVA